MIRHEVRKILWNFGYDVCSFDPKSHPLARQREIFHSYAIDVVLDVGANIGQFAGHVRNNIGFEGTIISFEPLRSAFEVLKKNASSDNRWQVLNFGLSDVGGQAPLNISANSFSSSLLKMFASHISAAPESRYIATETVSLKTLDSLLNTLCSKDDNIFLKIDTQGFESRVLRGAKRSLPRIDTIQLEMSLVPLYKGELPFHRMYEFLKSSGYELVSIEPVYFGEVPGQILQVDGVFHRF